MTSCIKLFLVSGLIAVFSGCASLSTVNLAARGTPTGYTEFSLTGDRSIGQVFISEKVEGVERIRGGVAWAPNCFRIGDTPGHHEYILNMGTFWRTINVVTEEGMVTPIDIHVTKKGGNRWRIEFDASVTPGTPYSLSGR